MRIKRRRYIAIVITIAAAGVVGGIATVVSAIADTERIGSYWISAELGSDGLRVTEVIDYDFGVQSRHGIYRTIPDVVPGTVEVQSPTAPDHADVSESYLYTTVKIGDAARTITGRHRYHIEYVLEYDAVVSNGLFAYDAVGFDWNVSIDDFRVTIVLPTEVTNQRCAMGTAWDEQQCTIVGSTTGHWVVEVDHIDAGDGITVSGRLGNAVASDPPPVAPTGPASDPGIGIIEPFITAAIAALLMAIPVLFLVRRAGRERVWQGGAADAAWGEADEGRPSERVDEGDLGELATIEFEPPRDMSAVEGAILMDEKVQDRHLSAWLLESAIRDEIEITGSTKPVLHRGDAPPHPSVHPILDAIFGQRQKVDLGEYDEKFAEGWTRLRGELDDWLNGSAHWDSAGRRRRTVTRGIGFVVVLVGLAVMAFGAVGASRDGSGAWMLIAGALTAGGAVAAMVHSFELLVRTETGSAYWLRVESFRRFLHNSEARHVNEAAEKGVLRQYTAWAVALDESDSWFKAVDTAARENPAMRSNFGRDIAFVAVGGHIHSAAKSASVAPSSSGSGGFGGGAGGGGGGGGGGSW